MAASAACGSMTPRSRSGAKPVNARTRSVSMVGSRSGRICPWLIASRMRRSTIARPSRSPSRNLLAQRGVVHRLEHVRRVHAAGRPRVGSQRQHLDESHAQHVAWMRRLVERSQACETRRDVCSAANSIAKVSISVRDEK